MLNRGGGGDRRGGVESMPVGGGVQIIKTIWGAVRPWQADIRGSMENTKEWEDRRGNKK